MICLYGRNTTDYSGNGLRVLDPYALEGQITEELNGDYTFELTLSPQAGALNLQEDMVVRLPAPVRETPYIHIYHPPTPGSAALAAREIWKVQITTSSAGGYSRIYQRPNLDSRVLAKIPQGGEYEYLGRQNSNWHRAVSADGATGYMWTANSVYLRTEQAIPARPGTPGYSTVVQPRKTRDQLFRVLRVTSTLAGIRLTGRHIFYDLLDNYLQNANAQSLSGIGALDLALSSTAAAHGFNWYSNIESTGSLNLSRLNPVNALIGNEGLTSVWGGEFLRDNFDIFWLVHMGEQRGVSIAYRKNMTGLEVSVDDTSVVTRVIPVGYAADDTPIYLDTLFVDSPQASLYDRPRGCIELEYRELKVGQEGYPDAASVKAELAARGAAYFAEGSPELPQVSIAVDYVDLRKAHPEVAGSIEEIYLGDTVTVKHEDYGIDIPAEVVAYTWDVLRQEMIALELGNKQASMSSLKVDPSLIPDGSLSGRKIGVAQVDGMALAPEAVSQDKIQDGAIRWTKIDNLAVEQLIASSITAAVAKLDEVISGRVDTNELYAKVIEAVTAEIENVTAGEIATNALYAQIVKATAAELEKVTAGAIETNELYAAVISAAAAELGKVTAEMVDTNELYAGLIHAMQADLGRITVDNAEISALYAAMVNAVHIAARSADIDFLKVIDLTAGNAIFRIGTGGEMYIDRLTVNEGNLVSLSTGKLMVKGVDGKWYTLQVGSDGITPVRVEEPVTDANIGDSTISGGKIVEGSINVDRLSAATIQGNQAFLAELTAGLGNFGTLFANEAITEQLKTHLINSDYLKVAIEAGENVAAYFEFLASGLRISAPGSQFFIQISNEEIGFYQSGVKVAWITGSMLRMPRAKIESELQIGQFSWVKESNGSLSLQYVS